MDLGNWSLFFDVHLAHTVAGHRLAWTNPISLWDFFVVAFLFLGFSDTACPGCVRAAKSGMGARGLAAGRAARRHDGRRGEACLFVPGHYVCVLSGARRHYEGPAIGENPETSGSRNGEMRQGRTPDRTWAQIWFRGREVAT